MGIPEVADVDGGGFSELDWCNMYYGLIYIYTQRTNNIYICVCICMSIAMEYIVVHLKFSAG